MRTFRQNGVAGAVRAFLSDRFKVLDNIPFIETVLAAAQDASDGLIKVQQMQVDEDRVFIRLVTERAKATHAGHIIQQGLTFSNSEVGTGMIKLQPWGLDQWCMNGLTAVKDYGKVHLGGELDIGILTGDTIEKRAQAVWGEVRDFTANALTPEHLEAFVRIMDAADVVEIEAEPRIAIANVVKTYGLTGSQGTGILDRFLRDASQLGETQGSLVAAVTRSARDADTFRQRVEMEELGGRMLEMDGTKFLQLTNKEVSNDEMERAYVAA